MAKLDLVNKKFGKLTIISFSHSTKGHKSKSFWKCLCDCGKIIIVGRANLISKNTKSCGCSKYRTGKICNLYKHGLTRTQWTRMVSNANTRCYNINSKDYINYGGRGIKIWNPWKLRPDMFASYLKNYLGVRPKGYLLDRIDNNGNYEPGNLKYSSAKDSANNRQNSKVKVKVESL